MLDPRNEKELREVQKLRYDYLLRDFDENKNDSNGLDDDGYDAFSESLIAVEKKTGRIVGTYRVATDATLKGSVFKCEEEFDISSLRKDPGGIVEAGRAVIHRDYRGGVVFSLLWRGVITYARDLGLRYVIGTCSLHGTDPGAFVNCTSYLNEKHLCSRFEVRASHDSFEYGSVKGLSAAEAGLPGLLKAYLKIGATVSQNGFIDYDFNCCDVMIILDRENMNERFLRRFAG
jgi:putative hemolysin